MNVATVKLMCWLASLAFTGGLGAYAYDFFSKFEDKKTPYETAHVEEVLKQSFEAPTKAQEGIDYDDVKKTWIHANWTGEEKKVVEVARPVQVEVPKPTHTPVADILKIMMVQENPAFREDSIIHVDFVGGRITEPKMGELHEGDALPKPQDGIVVHSIRVDGVEFRFKDGARENETILPRSLDDDALIVEVGPDGARIPVRKTMPRGAAAQDTRSAETREVSPGRFRIGYEDAAYINDNYARILTNEVRTRTWHDPKTGRRAGVEVQEVQPGSIAARHGMKDGMVVKSINGHPVTSQHEAIKFAKNNSEKYSVWNIVYTELGREKTYTYIPDSN